MGTLLRRATPCSDGRNSFCSLFCFFPSSAFFIYYIALLPGIASRASVWTLPSLPFMFHLSFSGSGTISVYVLSGRNAGVYLFSSGVLGSIVEPGTLGVFRDPLTLRCYAHVRQRGVLSSPQANLQCCAHVLCLFVFPVPFVELHQ